MQNRPLIGANAWRSGWCSSSSARSPASWPASSASAAVWCWWRRWPGSRRPSAFPRKRRCTPRWPVRWPASC
ncbi:hypothetical protein [Lysobacter gummosus]|uniref:hypothetical protein n=1 Tax=Lysobacter gummosus TaxID=262324 RepID=UPI0036414A7C